MQENETILAKAENYVTRRKWFMAGLMIGVLMICASFFAKHLSPHIMGKDQITLLRVIGWVIWFTCLLGTVVTLRKIRRDTVLSSIINDETANENRTKMFMFSYFILFASAIIALLFSIYNQLDARLSLLLVITIGGISPPLLYIILNSGSRK